MDFIKILLILKSKAIGIERMKVIVHIAKLNKSKEKALTLSITIFFKHPSKKRFASFLLVPRCITIIGNALKVFSFKSICFFPGL